MIGILRVASGTEKGWIMSVQVETILAGGNVAGLTLLGEIVSWDFRSLKTNEAAVRSCVAAAGLDEAKFVAAIKPRNAFTRALADLQEERIIRKVDENPEACRFQFTKESKSGDGIDYNREAILTLDKKTGLVACPERADLAQLATDKIAEKKLARTANDLHRIVSDVFESNGDLYPVRTQGGCYFVPQQHRAVSDQVAAFVEAIGGNYRRFPIPQGCGGEKSVKESMTDGLAALLKEYRDAAESFDPAINTELKLNNGIKRVQFAKLRIDGYAALLAEAKDGLLAEAESVEALIKKKIAELAAFCAAEKAMPADPVADAVAAA